MNKQVYLLCHSYEYGTENEHEEIKVLGIYSSEGSALLALERYYNLVGFNKFPKECFSVQCFIIDKDESWKEGFIGWDEVSDFSE